MLPWVWDQKLFISNEPGYEYLRVWHNRAREILDHVLINWCEITTGKDETMHQDERQGIVVAVSVSPHTGVPKIPQDTVIVGEHGVVGDFHAGVTNKHKKSGPSEPNLRQLTIVAQEALDSANEQLDIALGAGSIGENVLVDGLGDLSGLVVGDVLRLGEQVSLRVTSQNKPCATLNVYHGDIVKTLLGIRGVAAVVDSTGVIKTGDTVLVERVERSKTK